MDGAGRAFPPSRLNEIPFFTSYSHKSALSKEKTSLELFQHQFQAFPAAPIPAFSKGFWSCLRAATSPLCLLQPSPRFISFLFVLPKGKILRSQSGKGAFLCLPPGIPVSSSILAEEASLFWQTRILIIHSKPRQHINKGENDSHRRAG